jgi:hypothetical protein
MSLEDVPPQEWASTLERFGREHRAWLATVEHLASDGTQDIYLREAPLAGVFAEPQARGVAVRIDLAAAASPGSSSVRIPDPVAVRLERDRDAPAAALEIDDSHGGRTCLRFRVNPPLDMLDGLAPGEL